MKNLNLCLIRIAMIFGIVVGLFSLSIPALATGDDPPTPEPPPIPITQMFIVDEEFSIAPYSDLVITSFRAPQPGYQAGTQWNAEVEVRNVGSESVGPFEIHGYIGRYLSGDTTLSWLPYDIYFGAITSLDPGQSELVESPFYDFPGELSDSLPTTYISWIDGFPDRGMFYLFAYVDATDQINERDENNNIAIDTMIYPSVPEGEQYDFEQDSDGDGFYDPIDCYDDDPQAYPGAEEIYHDGIDQDCEGGDRTIPVPGHAPPVDLQDHDNDGDGYSEDEGDCNDGNPNIYPGADEFPNEIDDNCNYAVDEIVEPGHEPQDLDGDGYISGDCDPFNSAVNPGQNELYDGIDNDCDFLIDEFFYTPDWIITNFSVERDHSECEHPFTHPESWNGESCGLRYSWQIENLGEESDLHAINHVGFMSYMTDLVRDYDTERNYFDDTSGAMTFEGFFPYYGYAFQGPAMLDLMACGPIGFIALIPEAEWGGPLGEENVSNNYAIFYPPQAVTGVNIRYRPGNGIDIYYPGSFNQATLQVNVLAYVSGSESCPPPEIVDFTTQVRVLLNGSQIYQNERFQDTHSGRLKSSSFYLPFFSRPHNGDEIEIEVILNSGNRVPETSTLTNKCRIYLSYHRSALGGWSNDTLEVVNHLSHCSGDLFNGGLGDRTQEHYGEAIPAAWQEDLTSSGPWSYVLQTGFIIAGLFIAIASGIGGWIWAGRAGWSGLRRLLAAFGGTVIAGSLTAGMVFGVAYIRTGDIQSVSDQREIEAKEMGLLVDSGEGNKPTYCTELLEATPIEVVNDGGEVQDIIIQIQPGQDAIPPNSRFRITIWGNQGNPYIFTTEETSLSLASEGLFPGIENPFLWQVEVETLAGVGGDLYLLVCNPTIYTSAPDEVIEDEVIGGDETPETPTPTATTPPKTVPTKVPPTVTTPPKAADTKGPKVSGASASPNPALTTSPVTISTTISDSSGVARARIYIKKGKGEYQSMGTMKSGGGNNYFLNIGTLTPAGTYTFRILAEDILGNANCSTGNLDACPGGTFVVNIP